MVSDRPKVIDTMRITYLSLAVLDLVAIRAYLSTNNSNLAQPLGNKLKDSFNGLAQFSNLSKQGRVFGTRELIIPKVGKSTDIVVYRVVGDEVQILRVLAVTQDIDTILAAGFWEAN
jgi:toxin ParE1/3/4